MTKYFKFYFQKKCVFYNNITTEGRDNICLLQNVNEMQEICDKMTKRHIRAKVSSQIPLSLYGALIFLS